MNQLELIAHLSSRLCHDLVGPISAVGNGVEVMEDEDDADMQKQAIELLAHSADLASRRLKFFRLAFGAAGGEGVPIQLSEARSTSAAFLEGGRTTLSWPDTAVSASDQMPKTAVKLLMNLILVASESLPRGGSIEVDVAVEGGTVSLLIRASGPSTKLSDAAEQALGAQRPHEGLDPKSAPAMLAALLAESLGTALEFRREAELLSFQTRFSAAG